MRHNGKPTATFIDKINVMSLKELEHQLPLAQNSLEAIEVELEELMALRDANVIRVAAMTARLAALKAPRSREGREAVIYP
jgi:hypothetical protein